MMNNAKLTIQRYHLLSNGDTVIVALSGGADSIALASFLDTVRQELGLTLQAAHVNHGLRGEEGDRDEAFVREFCESRGIPLAVRRADVRTLAKKRGEGLEACGRWVRYAFFEELAQGRDCVKIATAHTLSDSAETLLLHLARGCGLRGAGGIAPRRGNIIRPLIHCTRQEIEAYCAENSLAYVTDSTNADLTFARNRVRSAVLPELMRLNPGFLAAADRFMEYAREEDAFLEELAQGELERALDGEELRVSALNGLNAALRRRVLRRFAAGRLGRAAGAAELGRLEEALQSKGATELCGGARARIYRGRLGVFWPSNKENTGICSKNPMDNVNRIVLTYEDFLNIKENEKKQFAFCADYDRISGDVVLRARQPGDRLVPAGNRLEKPLKKLFQEAGIPAERRRQMPTVCDSSGVIGVWGLCSADRVALDHTTKRVLLLTD